MSSLFQLPFKTRISSGSIDVAPTFATSMPSVDLPTVAGTEVLIPDDVIDVVNAPETPNMATAQEALFNCVNILLGCGVLSIPYALQEGGWAAFGVLALMWMATNYTGKTLIECQEYFNRYPEVQSPKGSTIKLNDGLMASCVTHSSLSLLCAHLYSLQVFGSFPIELAEYWGHAPRNALQASRAKDAHHHHGS
jgi:hypothetical protein